MNEERSDDVNLQVGPISKMGLVNVILKFCLLSLPVRTTIPHVV